MWYNLPNRIKEIIAPYNDQLSDEAKKASEACGINYTVLSEYLSGRKFNKTNLIYV